MNSYITHTQKFRPVQLWSGLVMGSLTRPDTGVQVAPVTPCISVWMAELHTYCGIVHVCRGIGHMAAMFSRIADPLCCWDSYTRSQIHRQYTHHRSYKARKHRHLRVDRINVRCMAEQAHIRSGNHSPAQQEETDFPKWWFIAEPIQAGGGYGPVQ